MSKKIPEYIDIKTLINTYSTPLQIYDENSIRKNTRELIECFKQKFSFKQFFAVKALPNPHILKILIDEGCGLDCSSSSELKIAKMLKINSDNIIFTSNYTSKEDLNLAMEMGVIINLDDYSLIDKLYKISNTFPKKIFFRLNPGIGKTNGESESNILGGPNAKFGISPQNIMKCYELSKKYGCKEFGIHMMTGSCVMDNTYWKESIKILIDTINNIQNNLNIKINYINIGGGIGIPYKPEENKVNISELVNIIYETFTENNFMVPNLFMENGRYITGPYGWLVTKCLCKKLSFDKIFYGLDACMSNLMRPGMYNSYHHITILDKTKDLKKCNVVGTLCENNDWFAKDRLLPDSDIDDIFIIHDTGAHSHSMGFQYNGKLRAPEILINNEKKDLLIRRRELFDDYISTISKLHDVSL